MKMCSKIKGNVFLLYFVKRNKTVTILSFLFLVYCCICSIFKGSADLNINNDMVKSLGDLFYNIGISIIAAYIFLIFQSWLYHRREVLVEKYAKDYVNLYLLRDCELLQEQLKLIINSEKKEEEINYIIAATCERIQKEMYICTTKYRDGLSDNMYKNIEALFFDNEFYMIEKRANGKLTNMTMKSILRDCEIYGNMEKIIREIKNEVALIKGVR